MWITRGNGIIFLTPKEIEQAFEEKFYQLRLQDAKRQLADYFDHDIESEDFDDIDEDIRNKCDGITFSEMIDPKSNNYLLGKMVARFEQCSDCNVAENDTWQHVASAVVSELAHECLFT